MIKVLEHGNAHHISKCPSCGCRFEWTDTALNTHKDFGRGRLVMYCPECGLVRTAEAWKECEE